MVGFVVTVSYLATLLMYLLCVASGRDEYMRALEDEEQTIYLEEYYSRKRGKRKGIIKFKIGMP